MKYVGIYWSLFAPMIKKSIRERFDIALAERSIREGTCVTSDCCAYCIVGDKSPIAEAYELVKAENGLLLSVKKEAR